jgi:TorA maturation chaperone TorD
MTTAPADGRGVTSPQTPEERARADVYRLLGALLAAAPSEELLEAVREIRPPEGGLAASWKALAEAARATTLQGSEREYHDLFIGLGRGELNPYASWYLTGFLMEKPLAELRDELAALGITRRQEVYEPEDHAAALCETMAILLRESNGDAARCERFFHTYLDPWMPRFFEDLQGAKRARFYRAVGRLGRAFMEIEQRYYAMPA